MQFTGLFNQLAPRSRSAPWIGEFSRSDWAEICFISRHRREAKFSVNLYGQIWSHPYLGNDKSDTRILVNGRSPLIDTAATYLLQQRASGGRFYIDPIHEVVLPGRAQTPIFSFTFTD